MDRRYFVYILANRHDTVLYTGVTSDLKRRVFEHRSRVGGAFSRRYNVDKLVYYETFADAYNAIAREKQIKAGPRRKKTDLIEAANPGWGDLYDAL